MLPMACVGHQRSMEVLRPCCHTPTEACKSISKALQLPSRDTSQLPLNCQRGKRRPSPEPPKAVAITLTHGVSCIAHRPTVSLGVTSAVVCTYGCGDGRIALTRCALIDNGPLKS